MSLHPNLTSTSTKIDQSGTKCEFFGITSIILFLAIFSKATAPETCRMTLPSLPASFFKFGLVRNSMLSGI